MASIFQAITDHPRLRRLDHLPSWLMVTLGLSVGATAGVSLATASPLAGLLGFILMLALAAVVAYSGEPVAVSVADIEVSIPLQENGDWALIPAGSFRMGSNEDEREQPVHTVTISAFLCMRAPVTRRLYSEVMDKDSDGGYAVSGQRPMARISWMDAVRFCNRWSERDGLSPCYVIDGENVRWDTRKDGYRLLTEAEWEYACRAGSGERWCFGDDEARLADYAWYSKNSKDQTQPVRQKQPNTWGLYDMHGNVWEWCWDWFGDYTKKAQEDPTGPKEGNLRVLRGGAFVNVPRSLRSANRVRFSPVIVNWNFGFRCARGPRRQP